MEIKYIIYDIINKNFMCGHSDEGVPYYGDIPLTFNEEFRAEEAIELYYENNNHYEFKILTIQKVFVIR